MVAIMRHVQAAIGLVALACGGSDGARSDSAAAIPPANAATVTLAGFRTMSWINGPWRGFMSDGNKFYEWYRFLDDSTIHKTTHRDSTFGPPSEESHIMLRNGVVIDSSTRMSWIATRWDSSGADFAPRRGVTNAYTWTREDTTKWSATIRWTDEDGRPQTTVYALHRFGR